MSVRITDLPDLPNVTTDSYVVVSQGGVSYRFKMFSFNPDIIQSNTLDGAKIINNSLAGAKIADSSITTSKMASSAITSDKIADGSITGSKILDLAILGQKLADGTITASKYGANSIGTSAYGDGSIATNAYGDGTITYAKLAASLLSQIYSAPEILPGFLVPTARISPPTGYLMCDGAAVLRATYSDLFTAIGTAYGAGDGTTTFGVPDCRGRGLIGVGSYVDSVSGAITRTLGQQLGSEKHLLLINELAQHAHATGFTGYGTARGGDLRPGTESDGSPSGGGAGGVSTRSGSVVNPTGGTTLVGVDQAHNNMPPSIVVNWMIKT
jgi:microcystin-dependent protein